MKLKSIREIECKRCGYIWLPRTSNIPKRCSKCLSKLWNTNYVRNVSTEYIFKNRKSEKTV